MVVFAFILAAIVGAALPAYAQDQAAPQVEPAPAAVTPEAAPVVNTVPAEVADRIAELEQRIEETLIALEEQQQAAQEREDLLAQRFDALAERQQLLERQLDFERATRQSGVAGFFEYDAERANRIAPGPDAFQPGIPTRNFTPGVDEEAFTPGVRDTYSDFFD